jgi:hypothetical protein
MDRRLASRAWLALPLSLVIVGCTTPADRLSDAMTLADEGKFDEALVVLEEVQRDWPARPEASAARDAVEGIHERAALARYRTGDYSAAVRELDRLGGPARARLFEKAPGMRWVPKLLVPEPGEETLLGVLAAPDVPEGLKGLAANRLCQRAATLAPVCRGQGLEPARLDIAEAIGALERVDNACRVLEAMRGRCQGEDGTLVFNALEAKFGQKLRTRIAELEKKLSRTRLAGDQ